MKHLDELERHIECCSSVILKFIIHAVPPPDCVHYNRQEKCVNKKVSRLFINRLTKLDFMLFYAEILAYILEHKNFDGFHGGSFFERHCNVDFIH